MNELLINFLKKITNSLEQSSLDKSLKDNTQGGQNSILTRFLSALFVIWLMFFPVMIAYSIFIGDLPNYDYIRFSPKWFFLQSELYLFFLANLFIFVDALKRIKINTNKILPYLYLIFLPTYFSSFIFLFVANNVRYNQLSFFNAFSAWLIIIYPLIYLIQSYFRILDISIINKIKNFFFIYNLWFLFLLTFNVALISVGFELDIFTPWTRAIIELLSVTGNYTFWLFEGLFYILICLFSLTFWAFSLNIYFKEVWKTRKNLYKWLLLIILVFLISLIPSAMSSFYDVQISRAARILSDEWQNYKWYADARVFLLDSAFLSKIKNNQNIDLDLFKKIYDSTPEEYFWDQIADYTDSRLTFATNSSKVWDKANVVLTLAEIENRINTGSIMPILETIYRFNFTNSSDNNEEVIINFETPTKNSVVSNLRLWLDLEFTWQIAPRWVARQVYEDSLRKNIDPALIEKIWLNTYNLRVFPVPSRQDIKTQWRQLVEVKILTPILDNKEQIIYSPKFSFINLKFDENSGIISKVYNEWKLIKEDVVKNNEIEKYLTTEHNIDSPISNVNLWQLCISEDLFSITKGSNILTSTGRQNINKTSIFFDNSSSAARHWANNYYQDIFAWVKNYWGVINDVDQYSYNYDVNKIISTDEIKFYWYSDIDRIIDYIINNKITNQRIILVTDDDSFNFSIIENKVRDYSSLVTNQISIIKVGKGIKSYKQDINNILSAANGNIYEVASKSDIFNIIGKIFAIKVQSEIHQCVTTNIDENIKKIQWWLISNLILTGIKNEQDWLKIAELQTIIAKKYNIVNQFNSYIAVVTEEQQEDINAGTNSDSKYDVEYNNNEWAISGEFFGRNSMMPKWSGPVDFSELKSWSSIGSDSSYWVHEINPLSSWTKHLGSNKFSLETVWSSNSFGVSSYNNIEFSWRIDLSFLGILMFIIYMVELYLVLAFVIDFTRAKE